jgi:pyruvate/2-oxoglutarate dehydrogenase complex dihydrolipoamide acyltransferase (E2) component
MTTPEFDIIFRGDIVLGHQLADVKLKLQQLFKVDAAKVDSLFTGRPVPLKRKLDEATANKYREVLFKAGAQVELSPSQASATPNTVRPEAAPSQPAGAAAVAASTTAAPSSSGPQWTLAPVGADLLPAAMRPAAPAPVSVDISGLSVRDQTGNILDAAERQPDPVPQVDVPNLDVAELGATLADENHLPLPMVEIDLDDWEIADLGADLLLDNERPLVVPVVVTELNVDLAPAGSDLGQLKVPVTPLNPNISGLRLADNT